MNPVFFLCDEYQEIVSSNLEGLSDLNFWDKSRSSRTIGILSTQSVSSFYAAIGNRDIANTILQNFRQKMCFCTEDQATMELLNHLAGQIEVMRQPVSNRGVQVQGYYRVTIVDPTPKQKGILNDPLSMRN